MTEKTRKKKKHVWAELLHAQLRLFLAAMSSSKIDVVTQFVRPCFRSSPFFSFIVFEVSSCSKESQWCFNAV